MAQDCTNCNAPLGVDDLFCGECGAKVSAPLMTEAVAPATSAETTTARPSLLAEVGIFFVLAAVSYFTAHYLEVAFDPFPDWVFEDDSSMYSTYFPFAAAMATAVFVALRLLLNSLPRTDTLSRVPPRLAAQVICLCLAFGILLYGPITLALYEWFPPPDHRDWFEIDFLNAGLATVLYGGYLVATGGQ